MADNSAAYPSYVVYGGAGENPSPLPPHERILAIFATSFDAYAYRDAKNAGFSPHQVKARARVAKFHYTKVSLDDGLRIHLKDVDIP